MKATEKKSPKGKSFGLINSFGSFKGGHTMKGISPVVYAQYKNAGGMVLMLLAFLFLLGPGSLPTGFSSTGGESSSLGSSRKSLALNSLLSQGLNASFSLGPRITNLDGQRKSWWKANPNFRNGRPKLLLVSGSQPTPCERSIDSHVFTKTAKNKVHFSRMHDFQMHYSLVEPTSDLTGSWAKLSVLRMLMTAHLEVEWFWWMDADTVVTDMEFNIPLQKYKNYNLVVYGDKRRALSQRHWQGLSTSSFLIRNSDWSIRMLDAWGSFGRTRNRGQVGRILSEALYNRFEDMEADEQSALVYLLATGKKVWTSKTFIEEDIPLTSNWNGLPIKTDQTPVRSSAGAKKTRPAVVTKFSGCSRCDSVGSGSRATLWPWEQCKSEMERAMDFADDQMYRQYGFYVPELGVGRLDPIPGHKVKGVVPSTSEKALGRYRGFPIHKLPGPILTDWDSQRKNLIRNSKMRVKNELGYPKVMIVTGSSPNECAHSEGSQFLLQALKNKVDYARFHDMQMYYGMADFDRDLDYWWTKIPTIRVLMLAHPDVEWFWWCDGDAVITDMIFEFPYDQFDEKNLVLYGDDTLVYEERSWIGVNAGIYLIRNCQWSLDLFDAWAALGVPENRVEAGKLQSKALPGRSDRVSDDQSALLWMLLTDEEKQWAPYINLERSITLSGYWKYITIRFEEMKATSHPGQGNMDWPWITHFAGCQPCGHVEGNFDSDECRLQIRRAHNFADDQVLALYGLEHSSLESQNVRSVPITPTTNTDSKP